MKTKDWFIRMFDVCFSFFENIFLKVNSLFIYSVLKCKYEIQFNMFRLLCKLKKQTKRKLLWKINLIKKKLQDDKTCIGYLCQSGGGRFLELWRVANTQWVSYNSSSKIVTTHYVTVYVQCIQNVHETLVRYRQNKKY